MVTNNQILNNLIEKIQPIDFREKSNLKSEKERLLEKHYLVNTIDEVLNLAQQENLGLCMHNGMYYVYNGMFWKIIEEKELSDFLGNASQKLGVEKFDARHYIFKNKLSFQFIADTKIPNKQYDKSRVLINLQNGTFEFNESAFILREFQADDFLTYQLPFNYEIGAESPLFLEYLNRVLPDKKLQNILSEFIGYLFLKDLKLEKCLLLYGGGANGKSVFFDIIRALLGIENVSTLNMGNLNDPNGRVQIVNKLLNYGSELNAGDLRTETLKQLISGEPIECKYLYKDKFQSSDYARLIFNCNELPHIVQHNEAYFRRFLIIPFNVTIPENERNPKLAQAIIENELPGVFNWVLEGLTRLMNDNSFSESNASKEALNEYKLNSDSVALFLKENSITKSNSSSTKQSVIYSSYSFFCKENGHRACSNITFGNRLKALGFESCRKSDGMHVFAEFSSLPVKTSSMESAFFTSSTSNNSLGIFSEDLFYAEETYDPDRPFFC